MITLLAGCKAKQATVESANEINTGLVITDASNTEKIKDNLESALKRVSDRMAELASEHERLLTVTDKENPIVRNLENTYLELLEEREQIQIRLANLKAD